MVDTFDSSVTLALGRSATEGVVVVLLEDPNNVDFKVDVGVNISTLVEVKVFSDVVLIVATEFELVVLLVEETGGRMMLSVLEARHCVKGNSLGQHPLSVQYVPAEQ